MPGLYLLAILVPAGALVLIDAKLVLVFWRAPVRAALVVALGTAFFVVWDLVGIAAGVFVQGGSPLYIGWQLAPHLPVEEPVFLAFLSYLALVAHAGVLRLLGRRGTNSGPIARSARDTPPSGASGLSAGPRAEETPS